MHHEDIAISGGQRGEVGRIMGSRSSRVRVFGDARRIQIPRCASRSAKYLCRPFQGAVLEDSDGRPIVGDIELHFAARDWYSHNHRADANYNSVVLHAVMNGVKDRATFQQPEMISPVAKFPEIALLESGGQPHLSFDCISGLGIEDTGNMLDTLGDKRFSARSHGVELEL